MKICNEREAFLFGQCQTSVVPKQFRQAFLQGVHDTMYEEKPSERPQGILDPEVESAYKKLLSVYKTKTAVAKAINVESSNLCGYIAGRIAIGPRVKKKFLAAAREAS